MGLAPLNTPLHAKPRSRRPANAAPPSSSMQTPGPSQQPRRLSPTPEEAVSPRAPENINAAFSSLQRTFSASAEFDSSERLVEEVFEDASEEELDDSILLGSDILSSIGDRSYEDRGVMGWKGWLGVAAFGVISGGVILIAGNARKETKPEKPIPSYCLHDRGYH